MGKKRAGAAALPSSKNNPAGNARVERPEAPGARTRLKVRRVRVADLFADPKNARKHGERNLAAVKESLRRFGQRMPIVVDANNVVRAGNARLEAAKQLGWDEIDVVDLPFDGAAAAAFALADNRTSDLGEFDSDLLRESLMSIRELGDAGLLGSTGFAIDEVDSICGDDLPSADLSNGVSISDGSVKHTYTCPSCGHSWTGSRTPPKIERSTQGRGARPRANKGAA